MKLTITIPTYNRPDKIVRQVRSILPQLKEGVSLKVYDNCSPTPVVNLFEEDELALFSIIRNNVNVGADANIARCLENETAGWVWLLGDDDLIKSDAVEIILKEIEDNPETCYVNFGAKKDILATSYEETLNYWGIVGAFGRSFFMTHCLFNMDKLKDDLRFYYIFLSSQVGQVCLIIKHLEANPAESVLFSTKSLIQYNEPGNWNPLNLVINSSIIIDKLRYDKPRLKSSLFKGLGAMYLTSLTECIGKYSIVELTFTYFYVQRKLGLINLLRYNIVPLCGLLSKIILPSSLYQKLRSTIASKYNKSIK